MKGESPTSTSVLVRLYTTVNGVEVPHELPVSNSVVQQLALTLYADGGTEVRGSASGWRLAISGLLLPLEAR